ncbi:EpsG family protein [Chryseobacterium sp. RG1]|uniref:EpsG family protein n=1 Tax=Chryseobacterium tagetis TaxID=2801334 RepID=A0ABS8A6I1_9FLAO|nr:EpsG family protein [Chryseobacterium tagetis]MCA6069108.1 EpsG family protein [Chryseobacterium tagetis]
MIPYLILYFSISLASVYNVFIKRYNYTLFLILILIIGFFSGSRVTKLGGYDTDVYKQAFEEVPSNFFNTLSADSFYLKNMEKGYAAVNWLAKSIGLNFNEFLLCLGIISALGLYVVFKRYSQYYFVVLMIFLAKGYLYYFFTAQRQVLAMIICWCSIYFILNKRFWIFFLCILIAIQFHTSSIIFFVAYFCNLIRFNNKWSLIIVALSLMVGLSNVGLLIGQGFSAYLPGEQFSEKLNNYLENSDSGVNILNFIELVPVFLIMIYFRKKIEEKFPNFNFFFNIFLVFLCLTFAFYNFQFIARLKGYFVIGYIMIISSFLYIAPNKIKFGILSVIMVYCLAVFVRELLVFDNGEGYLPYQSFLFE